MLDLYNNKYDRTVLKENIYDINLVDVLKTQILDLSFVIRYVLNDSYQLTDEEKTIDIDMVLKFQPHIQREKLIESLELYNSDDDSIEDFETYSKKNLNENFGINIIK
jgi:hypothetical protein